MDVVAGARAAGYECSEEEGSFDGLEFVGGKGEDVFPRDEQLLISGNRPYFHYFVSQGVSLRHSASVAL